MKFVYIFLIVFMFQDCNLYEKEEVLLSEFELRDKQRISIYYVAVGATANNNIQVRKTVNSQTSILGVYEGFNYLKSYRFINDTILLVVLADTVNKKFNRIDSLKISIR